MDRNGPSTSTDYKAAKTKVQLLFKVLFGVIFGIKKIYDIISFKEFIFHFQENK